MAKPSPLKAARKSNLPIAAGLVLFGTGMALFPLWYTKTGPQVGALISPRSSRPRVPAGARLGVMAGTSEAGSPPGIGWDEIAAAAAAAGASPPPPAADRPSLCPAHS